MSRRFLSHFAIICLVVTVLPQVVCLEETRGDTSTITKTVDNGDSATHIDLTIIGSGFTSDEIDTYIAKANQNIDKMWMVNWFANNQALFNVWRIDAISSESGVDLVDETIYSIASQTPYDILIILHNYDGQEGVGAHSNLVHLYINSHDYFVLAHELGHVIGQLSDEYVTESTAHRCTNRSKFMLNVHDKPSNEKWSNLISTDPYEGAFFCWTGLYRPSENTIMKDSANTPSFDAVGIKAMDLGAGKMLGTVEELPPSLSLTGVTDDDTKSGILNVTATTEDGSGIERVEFYWAKVGEISRSVKIDRTPSYTLSVDTTQYQDGQYYLDTLSYDTNWNYARKTILFNISNKTQPPPELSVPLTIREVAGVDRVAEPCSTGVPFPLGLLQVPEGLAVFDSNNNPTPAQFKVLEKWREYGQDGSIKWLLVTFLADVSANAEGRYYLRFGNNPSPAQPVSVNDTGSAFQMGGQTFMKDFSAPFKLVLTEPDGLTMHHGSDLTTIHWSIEEAGPVRTCLKAESSTEAGKFGFIAWIYAYAGLDRWDMTVVLKNTPKTPQGPLYFKDFSVIWDQAGTSYTIGGGAGETFSGNLAAGETVYLYQDSSGTDRWNKLGENRDGSAAYTNDWTDLWQQGIPDFRGYKVKKGAAELGNGNHALGWARLGNAAVANRYFWQEYPKALEVEQNKIIVRLWPKYWNAHDGIHWLDDIQRKAHDISFRRGTFTEDSAQAFNYPLFAHCGVDWYRTTKAFIHIPSAVTLSPPDPSNLSVFEYNWVNFGGFYSDRIKRRYHDHYLQPTIDYFVRTGDPYQAYKMWVSMRHLTTITSIWVDNYQYPDDAGVLSTYTYTNPVRNTGTYTTSSDHHFYMPWNPEHWEIPTIYDSWRLFGDPLAYDAIQKIVAYEQFWVEGRKTNDIWETRQDSFPMNNLAEAYRILGDSSILTSMSDYVKVMWNTINKERAYYVPNVLYGDGQEKPFMIAYVVNGLYDYYSLTHDDDSLDIILGMVDYSYYEGYVNACNGFLYKIPIPPTERDQTLADAAAQNCFRDNPAGEGVGTWRMARALARSFDIAGEPYKTWFDNLVQHVSLNDITTWGRFLDWDNVCDLMHYAPREDTTPPDAISDLSAETVGHSSVNLTWTAPADAARYQLKYSANPMVERIEYPEQVNTHSNWWAANNVTAEPIPGGTGSPEEFIASGLEPGLYYFAIRSYDSSSNRSGLSNMASVVVGDYCAISTSSLQNGTVGELYNATLSASGGTQPYSWSITSGTLPDGPTLDSQSGIISGTPTQAGTYDFTVHVADSASETDTKDLSIHVAPTDTTSPTITSVRASGDAEKVIVVYSEPVQEASATAISNYDINNGIIISSASLGSDLKTVTLTTSPHSEGITYTLIVNNVLDRARNPNPIADNTQVSYTFIPQVTINNLTVGSGEAYEVLEDGLQPSALVYMDRTYTFTTVPAYLEGSTYIKTSGNDNGSQGNNFFSFDVDRPVTVYIAHADLINPRPSWLNTFVDTGNDLSLSTGAISSIFSKDFSPGTITLGGNEGEGMSMYTVIIVPRGITGPSPPTGLTVIAAE